MKIYVASSWRNEFQPSVVDCLRAAGYEVYDFRNPVEGDCGFHWSEIDMNWEQWTPEQFRDNLNHPLAIDGYKKDDDAIKWADACVLVLPSGRSSHFEAGEFKGAGKPVIILLSDGEPELMYRGATAICCDIEEVLDALLVSNEEKVNG